MQYDIYLSEDGATIERVTVTCLTAARPEDGERGNVTAEEALTTEPHMAWISDLQISDLGEVEAFEIPRDAAKFLR